MLPFVLRATHDRELAAIEKLLAHAEQQRDAWAATAADATRLHELERRRYDELLQQFMALKVKGAEVVPVTGGIVEPPVAKPVEHDAMKALIAEKAGTNYPLRSLMLRQLAKDRAAGKNDEQIEAAILRGVENTEGIPA